MAYLTSKLMVCSASVNKYLQLQKLIVVPNGLVSRGLSSTSSALEDGPMHIFDRKAKKLQRQRAAVASDVNIYDYIKDEVGYRLADRVLDIKRKFKLAADIGCGRGHVARHIQPDSVEELLLCDSNAENLRSVRAGDGVKTRSLLLDEEHIQLEEDSLDLVISSLSLHWVNDLPGAFSRILQSLRQDGVFLASVFGGDTLYELRSSLQLAELERRGGVAPHVSPFTEIRDVGSLMTRAGFTMLTIDTDDLVVSYPSMFELMWDLKGMAESNAARNRSSHLDRDVQFAAAAIYQQMYGKRDEDGQVSVPATFQIINMLGWKPHKSQPRPLDRGTGQVSLKDLHRLDEIVQDKDKGRYPE